MKAVDVIPDWYIERLDPEYRKIARDLAEAYPPGVFELSPQDRRRVITERSLNMRPPLPQGVYWADTTATSTGRSSVPVRIYRNESAPNAPTFYYIHGGGMWSGSIEIDHAKVAQMCAELEWNIVTLDYRRAPECPHPAPMEDCVTTYLWLIEEGNALDLDVSRLVMGGLSAGGGLALATALWLKDNNKQLPRMLMLQCPMVDDSNSTPSTKEFDNLGPLFWDRTKNVEAWGWYLAGQPADGYAAPLSHPNLAGLPPTFIDVGELDPFYDEDVVLAQRLTDAGVTVELQTYSGLGHATEYLVPQARLSGLVQKNRAVAMQKAII